MKSENSSAASLSSESSLYRLQSCLFCGNPMGDMPGSRDAVCHTCGYKDPCCE